jgi:hypothetical protein
MNRSLPTLAILLGAAGVIPFILLGVGSVGLNPVRSLMAVRGLVGYGGVILSFVGGVHWGFTLGEQEPRRAVQARLGLGVVPGLIGWAAILASVVIEPSASLAILIAGFIGVVVTESRAQRLDLMPAGYMALRWVITVVVVALLTTVLVLRLAGARILL